MIIVSEVMKPLRRRYRVWDGMIEKKEMRLPAFPKNSFGANLTFCSRAFHGPQGLCTDRNSSVDDVERRCVAQQAMMTRQNKCSSLISWAVN